MIKDILSDISTNDTNGEIKEGKQLQFTSLIKDVKLRDSIISEFQKIEGDCEQELMSAPREGITDMLEIGEYAFPDFQDQFDYDMMFEDMTESIKAQCKYEGELSFSTWSSKSGTSVFIESFENTYGHNLDDVENDISGEYGFEYSYNDVDDLLNGEEYTIKSLKSMLKDVKSYSKEISKDRKAYDKMVTCVTKIIESYAEGVRSGVFSNGEVIFTKKGKQDFTKYYNPNESLTETKVHFKLTKD